MFITGLVNAQHPDKNLLRALVGRANALDLDVFYRSPLEDETDEHFQKAWAGELFEIHPAAHNGEIMTPAMLRDQTAAVAVHTRFMHGVKLVAYLTVQYARAEDARTDAVHSVVAVRNLTVHPDFRSKGVGRLLVDSLQAFIVGRLAHAKTQLTPDFEIYQDFMDAGEQMRIICFADRADVGQNAFAAKLGFRNRDGSYGVPYASTEQMYEKLVDVSPLALIEFRNTPQKRRHSYDDGARGVGIVEMDEDREIVSERPEPPV